MHFSSATAEWATPQGLFDDLSFVFGGFTLDPCATPQNAKCARFFTKEEDGLSQSWSGKVFMNPPYGREIDRWVKKAWEESVKGALVVCLLPARVDTRTFFSGAELTGNFTASLYAKVPTGATYGRFRDVQASAEFDKPFGGTIAEPRGIFSLAGYGQYQYDPTVLNITQGNLVPGTNISLPSNAQVLLGTKGWICVAQGKIVFNLSKGLSIPVALKWSNKTDLLKGSDVSGQLGLSYDLSALSKLVSSKD